MIPHETSQMAARRVSPRIHAVPAPRTSLLRFVDALDTPVALTNASGRLTTMNGPARDLFVGRAGMQLRDALETSMRLALGDRRRNTAGRPNHARSIEIGHERFLVTIVFAGTDVAGQDIGAMIMLRREAVSSPQQATESSLARRFGLTPQESRVALMLAEHRSNREIASTLGVSVHTARHHTEHVLAKLHIHSRYDVRKAIA